MAKLKQIFPPSDQRHSALLRLELFPETFRRKKVSARGTPLFLPGKYTLVQQGSNPQKEFSQVLTIRKH